MLNHNVKRFTTERPRDSTTDRQAVLIEIPEMKGKVSLSPARSLIRTWNLRSSFIMITRALHTI
jgi:hypothetical protein